MTITHTAKEMLLALHERGVRVWVQDGDLRFQAPKGTLHTEDLSQLRSLKSQLMEMLGPARLASELPLKPRSPASPVPLTPSQLRSRAWMLEQAGGLSERTCSVSMRVTGQLDAGGLREACAALLRRHESLRTRIVTVDGVPRQHVDEARNDLLEVVDLSSLSVARADAAVTLSAAEFAREKVDLSLGPLFTARLFKLSSRAHVLILSMNHLITDGISNSILYRDLWALYREVMQESRSPLPDLPVQFPDYAVWQQLTRDAWLAEHQEHWRQRLAGAPRIQLPFDKRLAESKPVAGAALRISFGIALTASLREVARRERAALPLVLLTVYIAVLARWCEQRDLLLRFIANGHYRSELQDMVGFLVNILHLRVEVSQHDSFLSLLQRVSVELQRAYEHLDFNRVPDLIPGCATPLVFNWMHSLWDRESAEHHREVETGLRIDPFPLDVSRPFFQFLPLFSEGLLDIQVTVLYQPDLLHSSTVEWFGDALKRLAAAFAHDPLAAALSTPIGTRPP